MLFNRKRDLSASGIPDPATCVHTVRCVLFFFFFLFYFSSLFSFPYREPYIYIYIGAMRIYEDEPSGSFADRFRALNLPAFIPE